MAAATTHLDEVGRVAEALTALGLEPVLVGGMALVTLGSRRVTRDFDFIVARPGDALVPLLRVFYNRGFELASRLDASGDIVATIDNPRVAATRLRIDAPVSAFFINPHTRLRIDLLFDFPEPDPPNPPTLSSLSSLSNLSCCYTSSSPCASVPRLPSC
jgi:hypothetical protein